MSDLLVLDAEPPGKDIVERLREVLDKAEAGELSSVAVALVYRDGSVSSLCSDAPSRVLLLASIHRLAHRVQLDLDDR